MSLLESGENYLESIYRLSLSKDGVHAIDIVNDLGFSKPSVSIALKKLKEQNYLTINSESHIILTPKGLEIAKRIFERHQVLSSLLVKLGVDKNTADEDACKIEHDLSKESFDALKKLYNTL
jgi:Mn-dependent DtxR family transcriptional regulator